MNYYLNERVDGVMVITSDYDMDSNEIHRYMKSNIIPKLYLDLLGCNGLDVDNRFIEYKYDGDKIDASIIEDENLKNKISKVVLDFHNECNFNILPNTILTTKEKISILREYIK